LISHLCLPSREIEGDAQNGNKLPAWMDSLQISLMVLYHHEMEFTPKQISKLRAPLADLHKAGFSYPAIGTMIDEYIETLSSAADYRISDDIEFDLSKKLEGNDNFRKFVIGDSQTMSGDYRLRIALWLTSDDCDYSNLTWEELCGDLTLPKIASLLASFLYRTTDTLPITDIASLVGSYETPASDNTFEQWSFSISVPRLPIPHTLQVRAISSVSTTTERDSLTHEGFLIIGPEDNGLILTECPVEESNAIWNLIGLVTNDEERKTRTLALWRNPSAILDAGLISLDFEKLLENWENSNTDNIMILNRKDEVS